MRQQPAPAEVALSDLVPLGDVPALLPRRRGKKVHISLVYRWASHGIGGVKLHTVKVGGVAHTAEAWLWQFFDRENAPVVTRTAPRHQARELDRLEAELITKGM